jgi:hypothetical protein
LFSQIDFVERERKRERKKEKGKAKPRRQQAFLATSLVFADARSLTLTAELQFKNGLTLLAGVVSV